jgi:hypothetical protein
VKRAQASRADKVFFQVTVRASGWGVCIVRGIQYSINDQARKACSAYKGAPAWLSTCRTTAWAWPTRTSQTCLAAC